MKIAYCIGALNLGGVGTVAHNLSQYFLKRGDEFHIVTTHHKGNFYDTAKQLDWPVIDVSDAEISLKKRMKSTYSFLLTYDVVINNHSDELLFILPALPNSIIKISVQHNTTIKSSKRLSFNSQYLNFSAGVSSAVTSVMETYHQDKEKIVVLPNGVSKTGNKTYDLKTSNLLRLLYVGRLDNHQKNIFILPKVLKSLINEGINATITVAGSGEHEEELKNKFLDLGLNDNFKFVGRISAIELGEFFESHDFVLNMSNWEGLPMVILEAMSAGIIPILSNIEPHKYALGTNISREILTANNSIDSYVNIMKKLHKNAQMRIEISKELKERWEFNFSIEAFGENYLNLIEDATKQEAKAQPVPLSKVKLPVKDKYKITLAYYCAQKIFRRTK
ncbi:glycosyltransferase family 4 protein [Winogradskyella thalassocola]|uniref:Glycosyltransferase involved in cell wall bisynthesis n=1 Tax=Winogradskyella thalassocola TaxID=262004 RepID=A0A1G7Z0Q0_9FLAO|nr:glycosyltransferase family 4 protein [Winogradskyella thalassocola]SDH02352.1 Glycosyltransferase involved in cell wall bisynthesis [Winogradskyella thalassocola]